MNTPLVLNLASVDFTVDEVDVITAEYPGDDYLDFRAQHPDYLMRRAGDQVHCVPLVADPSTHPPGTQGRVSLSRNLGLGAALARNALLNYLHSLGRRILRTRPIRVLAAEKENVLTRVWKEGTQPQWLGVLPQYELDVRVVRFDRCAPFVGLFLDVRTTHVIDASCADLLSNGVNLHGLYVGEREEAWDRRAIPRFSLVGRVDEIRGDRLQLADARDDDHRVVSSSDVFVEPRREAFHRCVTALLRSRADSTLERLDQARSGFSVGPGKLRRIEAVIKHLGGVPIEAAPGARISVGELLRGPSRAFPKLEKLPRTTYVFSGDGRRTATWHDQGLDMHGPYSADFMTPTTPRICVVCQARRKGDVEQFLHKFLHGTEVRAKRQPFAQGLIGKYRFQSATVEFFTADSWEATDYAKAARAAIGDAQAKGVSWDLALVQTEEAFHDLVGDANPYLVCKSLFLRHQIPSQAFESETMGGRPVQVAYSMNNMALATYAKMRGVPWILRGTPTISHELVVGLASASTGDGRLGERQRLVGITTIFSGDGNYWLSSLTPAVPATDYEESVRSHLVQSLERVAEQMNWRPNDSVRIIFHAFKPFRDSEVDAVRAVVDGLQRYDAEFAFLHVADDHPYLLLDSSQRGVRDFDTNSTKGVYAPERGSYIQLSRHEVLVCLTGARDVKRPTDGVPRPVLAKLHRASTFSDVTYLARQLGRFAGHSWRSFFPAPMPVTILYSQLAAQKMGQLESLSSWTPDSLLGRIGATRWFL